MRGYRLCKTINSIGLRVAYMRKRKEKQMTKGISHVCILPSRQRARYFLRHTVSLKPTARPLRAQRSRASQERPQTRPDRELRLSRHPLSLRHGRLAWRACELGNCHFVFLPPDEAHQDTTKPLTTEVYHGIPRLVHERYGRVSTDRPLSVTVLEIRPAACRARVRSKRTDPQPHHWHRWLLIAQGATSRFPVLRLAETARAVHAPLRAFLCPETLIESTSCV